MLLVVLALDGLTLRNGRGEADRGLPTAAAPSLRRRLDGDARQPGCQDVLGDLHRFEEAKSLMLQIIPVARRVFGESNDITLKMRTIYAEALYRDDVATLDDLREAVRTLEDVARVARRVLGGAHPTTKGVERELQMSRAVLEPESAS